MYRGGITHERRPDPIYARMAPPGHSRVCWAAAVGSAMAVVHVHGEEAARLAVAMLADGRAKCLCRYGKPPPTRR